MHRKLLRHGILLGAICLCSVITGVGVVLLTGGSVPAQLLANAPVRAEATPDVVLQSTAQAAPVVTSTTISPSPSAPSTPSPASSATSTPSSPAPTAPSPSSPSPSAATAPTSVFAPTVTSAVLPIVADTVLIDTFDTPTGVWPVRTQPTSSAGYVDGQYQLQINGQPATSVSTAFEDEAYRFAVDVTIAQGEAGLVFLADNRSAFYYFLVRPDGTYAIQRMGTAGTTTLVDWTTNASLQRGVGVPNRVQAARVGDTVRFSANDVAEPFAEFVLPSTNVTNHYGFVVAAADGRAQATFDNLDVERLRSP